MKNAKAFMTERPRLKLFETLCKDETAEEQSLSLKLKDN
jgi:hypothetical protein